MALDNGRLQPPDLTSNPQGAKIPRNSSRESLTTHPLLSSGHTEPTAVSNTYNSSSSSASQQPVYVPYVPRQQRPLPTSPPTAAKSALASTPVSRQTSAPLSSSSHGGTSPTPTATSKLQIQNLKAAAQKVGLNANTVGWAMLEKLASDTDLEKIWSALTVGKATLLLPAEDFSPGEKVTPEMIEDHVVFIDIAARASTPVVTLSGLRGILKESVLVFQSTLPPACNAYQPLHTPSLRPHALSNLPPLHTSKADYAYPKFTVYPNAVMLPIPPSKKPALPPRPGSQQGGTPTSATSRLPSFASLFGSRTPTPALTLSPSPATPHETDKAIEVSAVVIDCKIVFDTVSRQIHKELKREVQDTLKDAGVPSWVIERTFTFMTPYLPVVKSKKAGHYCLQDESTLTLSGAALSDAFQDFYDELEGEIRHGKNNSRRSDELSQSNPDLNEKVKPSKFSDKKVREIMESVEKTLCTILSDRLLRPNTSDDGQHDETLASRIAALNLLDLTPEHLGVDVGTNDKALSVLVSQCGKALGRLSNPNCQSPAEKGAALVAAHHILVDGLSKLPPIKLKPEQEIAAPKQSPVVPDTLSPNDDIARRGSRPGTPSIPQLTIEQELKPISPKISYREELEEEERPPVKINPSAPSAEPSTDGNTTVSGDILLPLIIYSVVKCNPSHLVSHLLFVQRFRNRTIGGEESYSLVNLMAVVEFLEHVDLEALGLGDTERVLSAEDLTPIPIGPGANVVSPSAVGGLRGRVVQQADAIAGSANKMLSGVVDSSLGALKGLLSSHPDALAAVAEGVQPAASWNPVRPGIGLLRRASGFSIASVAASLPGSHKDRGAAPLHTEEGQQLKDVSSRPNSIREEQSDEDDSDYEDSEGEGEEDDDEHVEPLDLRSDSRSVRSFSSMMSSSSKKRKKEKRNNRERKSLADRLASVGGLAKTGNVASLESPIKGSPAPSRRASALLDPSISGQTITATAPRKVAPAKKKFLEGSAYDLRLSEVNELIAEYRRVVAALSELDGFEGPPQ